MPILRNAPASPFGRKVRMAIDAVGMTDRVTLVAADTNDASDSLRQQNPLGKIPVLVLDSGEAVFDSRVIVEYLNQLDGRGILVPAGLPGIAILRQQALADGLMDAAILQIYEARFRPPEHQLTSWLDYQRAKVTRVLTCFEAHLPEPGTTGPHIGEIALAAGLGYLDFRFAGTWRADYPALVKWLADFAARVPAYARTAP